MADWNPTLYLRYADERTRPARELLARVPLERAGTAVDLGCGPGNSTALIAERYRQADLLGLDTSEAMLAEARERLARARFAAGDIAAFRPEAPVDLLYSNAALQWVPDHATLFPALFAQVAENGVFAMQMPDNQAEPTHVAMREVAKEPRFAARIGDADAIRFPLLAAERYYDLLAREASAVDLWRTTYHHVMDSAEAIVEWVSATGLRPFLDPLDAASRADFLAAYTSRIDAAYPARADGKRLLRFPRLFLVAVR